MPECVRGVSIEQALKFSFLFTAARKTTTRRVSPGLQMLRSRLAPCQEENSEQAWRAGRRPQMEVGRCLVKTTNPSLSDVEERVPPARDRLKTA